MRSLIAHLLEQAALRGALLALGGLEGVVLEPLLVALSERFDVVVRGGGVAGDLDLCDNKIFIGGGTDGWHGTTVCEWWGCGGL